MKILVLQHISIEDPGYIKVLFFIFAGLFFTAYNIGVKKWSVPAPQAVAISVFYSAVIFLPFNFYF